MSEADEWISWGTSMFYDENVAGDEKGNMLHSYLERQFDRAQQEPGDDFFSTLSQAEIDGRRLTREELLGFGNLAFAGGRDTVITVVSFALAHLASNPEDLASLRDNPKLTIQATEEIVRVSSPLTLIGRQCPHGTSVHGHPVPAGGRAALCWASANRDESVFDDAKAVRLDRSPNPHFGFGSGIHSCLGANQARLILRTLLERVSERASALSILELEPRMEKWPEYERQVGYEKARDHIRRRVGPGLSGRVESKPLETLVISQRVQFSQQLLVGVQQRTGSFAKSIPASLPWFSGWPGFAGRPG